MKKIRNLLLALLSVACVSAFAGCQFGVPTQHGGSSSSTSEKVSSSSVKENSSSEEEASSSKGSSSSGKESSLGVGGSSSSEDSSSSVEESSSSEDSSSNVGGSSSSEDSSSSVGGNPPITGAGCTEEEWNATMEALADVDNVTMTGGSISIDHNGEEGATKQVSTVLKLTEKGTYIYGVHMDGSSAGYVYEEYYIKEGSSYTEYFRSHHANEEWSEWRCYPDKKMGFSMADLTTIIPDDYSLYEYDAESGYMIANDVQHYSAALDSTLQFKMVAIQIVDGQLTSVAAEFAETVDLGFDICSLAFSYTDYGDTTFEIPTFYGDSEGLEFALNEDEQSYTLTDVGTWKTYYLIIPATYEGLPVTAIGDSAFENCYSLRSIEIPDSVITIGERAFYWCRSLTSVVMGEGVTTIGDSAFENCYDLTSIEIPDSVSTIGERAFGGCSSLTSIKIPDSVITIGSHAFYVCNSLTIYCEETRQPSGWVTNWNHSFCPVVWDCNNNDEAENGYIYTVIDGIRYAIKDGVATVVEQPKNIIEANISESITYKDVACSVTSIGMQAFYNCDSLTSIEIPDSVNTIDYSPFYNCDSLASVVIGDNVTTIGTWAFYGCSSLTSIEIPDSVTTIGVGAFSWCSSLTSIELSDSVTAIGEQAFSNTGYYNEENNWENGVLYIGKYLIEARTSISGEYTIKESTLCIAGQAFNECFDLTSIEIPDSVIAIDDRAFSWCVSLTSVVIGDSVTTIRASTFYGCDNLTSIVIPDSVTAIGYQAFYECDSLTSVVIGDGMTMIDDDAFFDCTNLTSITFEGTIAEWNAIEKGEKWNYNVPATEVVCKDGSVAL